ncbi:MAG: thiol-disulfide oxidoreductase DCC family protein [Arenimonas sp.]
MIVSPTATEATMANKVSFATEGATAAEDTTAPAATPATEAAIATEGTIATSAATATTTTATAPATGTRIHTAGLDDEPRYPLTLYYDASCPLCLAEMTAITRCDRINNIHLVDCSAPGFDDADCRAAGIATRDLMHRLHARDADGHWRVGVPAVAAAYRAVGVAVLGGFFASPRLQPWLARLYGWLADHRQGLSRLGLTGLFGRYVQWLARRAERRAAACHADACEIAHR